MAIPMIEVDSISKAFAEVQALERLSFSLSRGEVLGFLGPNGAGKSTAMKIITGFLQADQGRVLLAGKDVRAQPIAAKKLFGYLPEGAPLYAEMTTLSFLEFIADIRQLRGSHREQRIQDVVAKVQLKPVLHYKIDTLSKGYRRRVGIAQAILHDPEILILDEPTDGLDPNQKREMRKLITEMAARKAIIISTHILEEVEAVCNRVMIINHGRLIVDAKPDQLYSRSSLHNAITFSVNSVHRAAIEGLLQGVWKDHRQESLAQSPDEICFRIYAKQGESFLASFNHHLQQGGIIVNSLKEESGRLEEIFQELTTPRLAP